MHACVIHVFVCVFAYMVVSEPFCMCVCLCVRGCVRTNVKMHVSICLVIFNC